MSGVYLFPCRYCGADSHTHHVPACRDYGLFTADGIPTPAVPTSEELSLRDLGRAAGHPDPEPGACPACGQREDAPLAEVSLDLRYRAGLVLEDLPADHPIRQEVAKLTTRLALAEGKIQTATAVLEGAGGHYAAQIDAVAMALEILRR